MRQGDLRDRRAGLGTLRQHLPLELGIVTSPLIRLGVLHGVHLRCLVDTILAGHQPRFKVTWPDAYESATIESRAPLHGIATDAVDNGLVHD
jgi:hypothetical protein